MSYPKLLEILDPPSTPFESVLKKNDWGRVNKYFNLPFPMDYIQFINKYGSGQIGKWLTVFNPFSNNPHLSIIHQTPQILSGFSVLKAKYPEEIPYTLLFEPEGLLPWGISIDGDVFCWKTEGPNGNWSIVIIGRHSGNQEFKLSFSQFLVEAIESKITPKAIPIEWKSEKVEFESFGNK